MSSAEGIRYSSDGVLVVVVVVVVVGVGAELTVGADTSVGAGLSVWEVPLFTDPRDLDTLHAIMSCVLGLNMGCCMNKYITI